MSSPETTLLQRASDGVRTAIGVGGLIAVVLGLLIIFFPLKSGEVALQIVAAIIAAYALVVGVVYIGSSIFSRTLGGWARTGHILLLSAEDNLVKGAAGQAVQSLNAMCDWPETTALL